MHAESGIAIESEASRESRRNLEKALHRLRLALALSIALVCTDSKKAANKGGNSDILEATNAPQLLFPSSAGLFRANASPKHVDFPYFVLMALHSFDKYQGHLATTAQALGCSASALTRFFKADKGLWTRAKEIREAQGLHALK